MLREGDEAPDFALTSDAGDLVRLRALRGRRAVVYFYPRDDTPGCTREAIAFSGARAAFEAAGVAVYGVSRDSTERHCRFRDKYGLTVALLSDPDLATHRAFGAWGTKTMYGKKVEGTIRSTFLVDAVGRIARVWSNVKVDGHVDQVLAALGLADGGGATSGRAGKTSGGAGGQARAKAPPSAKAKATKTAPATKAKAKGTKAARAPKAKAAPTAKAKGTKAAPAAKAKAARAATAKDAKARKAKASKAAPPRKTTVTRPRAARR